MSQTNLVYNVADKPSWPKTLLFALQQVLAILAATIAVPAIVNNNADVLAHFGGESVGMSSAAALFGAGVGTLVYLLFTKFKSPVFLGSSFAFLGSMAAAFCGAATMATGYLGLIIGAALAGLVYVALSFAVKFAGTKWIDKIMPAVVIGPTVAIIGLSLAGNAVGDLFKGNFLNADGSSRANWMICLLCGMVTLFTTIIISVYGKKTLKMIPFVIGIGAGYVLASIFSGVGYACNGAHDGFKIIDFGKFANIEWYPNFTFLQMFIRDGVQFNGTFFVTILIAYVPVAFVVFAEHIADHKNLSTIIGTNLLEEPGLNRTLLGDGVGSIAGAFFGGCPNTTYGESIGAVAISGNASIRTIFVAALMSIVLSFIGPFSTFLATIPPCVMGGVCIALYGFIAVSGLKMLKDIDLGDNRNLFVVSVILIAGVGGLTLNFVVGDGAITITEVACALVLGIIVNLVVNFKKGNKQEPVAEVAAPAEEPKAEEPAPQPEPAPAEEPAEQPAEENPEEAPAEESQPEENPEEKPEEEPAPAEEPKAEEPAPEQKPQNNNGKKSGGKNKKRKHR